MAYSPLPAKVAGDPFVIGLYDIIKADLEASAPGVAAAKGDLIAATGANAVAPLTVGVDNMILTPDVGEATGLAWQLQPSARVYNDVDLDPSVGSWWTCTFNQERFDPEAMHSTVANTGRLTTPAGGTGMYIIGGHVEWDYSGYTSGERLFGIRIRLNGSVIIAQKRFLYSATSTGYDMGMDISTLWAMDEGTPDYVELQVYTPVDINVLAVTAYSPVFWATWQRRV